MNYKFYVKIDRILGIIYEKPVFLVKGTFDPETELDEFIDILSKNIKKHITESLL